MNPLDQLVPFDPLDLTEEQEEEFQRQLARIRRQQLEQQRRSRRQAMQRRQRADSSSDSEVEGPSMEPSSDAKLTPASGSTPPEKDEKNEKKDEKKDELVKIDPKEVGMSVGLKNLYSGKEDKRGRFQWQTQIPEVSVP